jgi:hypothetical protein
MSETIANLQAWIWKLRTEKPSLGSHSMKVGESSEPETRISSAAMAPLIFDTVRSPPVFTIVKLRMQFGTFREALRREAKKASWIWFSACRPWSHGKTFSGLGNGCVAICSRASAIRSAVIVYTGGSLQNSTQYFSGGYVVEDVSIEASSRGEEAGGAAGMFPGWHTGRCLLGIEVGGFRDDVLSDRCVEGAELWSSIGRALATAAAMLAIGVSRVQLKARNAMSR